MRFTALFPIACLLLLAVLSTAWQFDGLLGHGQLLPRQDGEHYYRVGLSMYNVLTLLRLGLKLGYYDRS